VDVDAQDIKMVLVVISIISTKQWITIFLFFIAITPLYYTFVVKWFITIFFLLM